jgi:hypothetical protein
MKSDRTRLIVSLLLCGGIVFVSLGASRWTPSLNFGGLVAAYLALWTLSVSLFFLLPREFSTRSSIVLIVTVAVLSRLAFLPYPPSDDVNRYLWEGRVLAAGISPYAHAPDSPHLGTLALNDPYHALINHSDMSAAYPPLMLALFSGVGRIWYHPLAMKLLSVGFDITAILFLLGVLYERRLPLRWAVLYALNPLVLYAFAGEGHFDAAQAAFLVGALFCYTRKKWVLAFLLAGLAIQVKYVAVFALPFLVNRQNWRYAWVAALTALAPYLPIVLLDSRQLLYCLLRFGSEFAFNGPIHSMLLAATGSMTTASATVKVAFAAVLGLAYGQHVRNWRSGKQDDPLPGMVAVFGALLLLSPTIHYWYLSWILPLVIIRPGWGWLIATLTSVAYFSVCRNYTMHGVWELSRIAFAIEWVPVLAVLSWVGVLGWRRRRCPWEAVPVDSVSVIVPVLNEAARIGPCAEVLLKSPVVSEVLVSDGGSTDDTVAATRRAGATVVAGAIDERSGYGRGGQIHAALQQATGDVVAIVHADTLVPPASWQRVLEMLRANPDVVGGSLGGGFDDGNLGLNMVEVLNDIRASCLSVPFGDQVQFFRRRVVTERNLFPAIPLMEDVEFSLRLQPVGRTVHLFGAARVSLRGWQTQKAARALLIIRLFCSYICKRLRGPLDTSDMYERYYGGSGHLKPKA